MSVLLLFIYETGDLSCNYWQDFVVVNNVECVDIAKIKEYSKIIMHCIESDKLEYDCITKTIMNAFEYDWWFLDDREIRISQTHTFWL